MNKRRHKRPGKRLILKNALEIDRIIRENVSVKGGGKETREDKQGRG